MHRRVSNFQHRMKAYPTPLRFLLALSLGSWMGHAGASPEAQRQDLLTLARAGVIPPSETAAAAIAEEFETHLKRTSPMAAENLTRGTLDKDELESRFRVFLTNRSAQKSAEANPLTLDPLARIARLLDQEPDLAKSRDEAQSLARVFLEQVGERSRLARDAILDGSISDEELQTRIAGFTAEIRSKKAGKAIDPAKASLPAVIESFIVSNYGHAPERAQGLVFSGTIEQKGKTRHFVIFKKRPNLFRMHVLDRGAVTTVLGFDGERGWSQAPGEPAVRVIGSMEAEIQMMARFDPTLVGYEARGARVEQVLPAKEGILEIRVVETDGSETRISIDTKTMTEVSSSVLRNGERSSENRFTDYRKVGVLNVAHVQEEWRAGVVASTTHIEKIRLNPGLLTQFFQQPGSGAIQYMNYMQAVRAVAARKSASGGVDAKQP